MNDKFAKLNLIWILPLFFVVRIVGAFTRTLSEAVIGLSRANVNSEKLNRKNVAEAIKYELLP